MNGLLNSLRRRIGAYLPAAVRTPLAQAARAAGLLTDRPLLRNVLIGATNICNASCIHCPTNKAETDHVLRGTMSMDMFTRLIDQIAEAFDVLGYMSLGVHGDGLLDPLVVERARYVHERLPTLPLHVNTNGAAYNPARHGALADYVHVMSLHTESLKPEVYDRLLAPLRLERVQSKMDMIVRDFGAKTFVSVPVSRANHDEIPAIEDYFLSRGAGAVMFHPITNRCSPNRDLFAELAFDPQPGACRGDITQDLILDWNGDVLLCCNDFAKALPMGDFSREPMKAVMASPERARIKDMLDAGRWAELPTCSKCEFDCGGARTVEAASL